MSDAELPLNSTPTLAPFAEENFSIYHSLQNLRKCLQHHGYTEEAITTLLKVSSLQALEPTYFYFYDHYRLPHTALGDLIRLFLLRIALPQARLREILGDEVFLVLINLGIFVQRDGEWAAEIDLFCAHNLYFATDHRYLGLEGHSLQEDPVMYIGADSLGLTYTAPQFAAERLLDLCCGSGIQGLVASRYAREVIAIDVNPRAIRFARFNAQLNGIRNFQARLGNLYESITGYTFNTILVNPPFVPSPQNQLLYRDGGATGEEMLKRIIEDSVYYLAPEGRLFIVSDLVNVLNYEAKLAQWWKGGPAHQLVFCTADRDDAQFSIPHCHAPFGQSFQDYNSTLEQWLHNFHTTGIQMVNFGYILIQRLSPPQTGSYYLRTIHNPTRPIHPQVENYFRQRELLKNAEKNNWFLLLNEEIKFRVEQNFVGRKLKIELFSPQNPYFTTYQISETVYHLLESLNQLKPEWQLFVTPQNRETLFDLIYKGILYLSPVRATGGKGVLMEELPAIENHVGIVELKTKTTPTCLSAYLSR